LFGLSDFLLGLSVQQLLISVGLKIAHSTWAVLLPRQEDALLRLSVEKLEWSLDSWWGDGGAFSAVLRDICMGRRTRMHAANHTKVVSQQSEAIANHHSQLRG